MIQKTKKYKTKQNKTTHVISPFHFLFYFIILCIISHPSPLNRGAFLPWWFEEFLNPYHTLLLSWIIILSILILSLFPLFPIFTFRYALQFYSAPLLSSTISFSPNFISSRHFILIFLPSWSLLFYSTAFCRTQSIKEDQCSKGTANRTRFSPNKSTAVTACTTWWHQLLSLEVCVCSVCVQVYGYVCTCTCIHVHTCLRLYLSKSSSSALFLTLYYSILYYSILYYTILYFTIMYYSMKHCTVRITVSSICFITITVLLLLFFLSCLLFL